VHLRVAAAAAAIVTSIILLSQPVMSMGLAMVLLGETPSSTQLLGVAFVIGGAFGLDESVLRKARTRLSLSDLTLPHEMARLVLAEQLYRAGTIIRGEPYHKG